MDLKTKFKRSAICSGVRFVRSARPGSFSSLHNAATSVSRDSNGLLTTTVYRKPNHTDPYLATYKPKIWKGFVDDTFTVLGKDYVDGFLQHLNSQQPTIRLAMEIETDNTIPFLDTSVSRDSNGLLTTTVNRKPTHTDQYLAYDSHHAQSVKRGSSYLKVSFQLFAF